MDQLKFYGIGFLIKKEKICHPSVIIYIFDVNFVQYFRKGYIAIKMIKEYLLSFAQ